MPKSKKLQQQIKNKLQKLTQLLDQIDEARIINSDDPKTRDPDILDELAEKCKEMIKFLADKKSKQLDDFGEPIVLATGLCSLVDEYNEEAEDDD